MHWLRISIKLKVQPFKTHITCTYISQGTKHATFERSFRLFAPSGQTNSCSVHLFKLRLPKSTRMTGCCVRFRAKCRSPDEAESRVMWKSIAKKVRAALSRIAGPLSEEEVRTPTLTYVLSGFSHRSQHFDPDHLRRRVRTGTMIITIVG